MNVIEKAVIQGRLLEFRKKHDKKINANKYILNINRATLRTE